MPLDDAEVEDENCGADSDGEEARERLDASAPTKRSEEMEWEDVVVSIDSRLAKGVAKKYPHLTKILDET